MLLIFKGYIVRLAPIAFGLVIGAIVYFWVATPREWIIDGVKYALIALTALLVGCYHTKNVIESAADSIKSSRQYFTSLRSYLRTVMLQRAMYRYISLIFTTVLYVIVALLFESNKLTEYSRLIAALTLGLSAFVIADALYFYIAIRLEINKVKDKIDRENDQDKARLRLIQELRESREKNPFQPDDHLKSYTTVHSNSTMTGHPC